MRWRAAAGSGQPVNKMQAGISVLRLLADLKEGLVFLAQYKGLLYPLLLTLIGITIVSPV